MYALRGDDIDDFWRFNISQGTWDASPADTPAGAEWRSALAWDADDRIYAFRGDNTTDFWVYVISQDQWSALTDALADVKRGGSLEYVNGVLYALRGENKTSLWRYYSIHERVDQYERHAGVGRRGRLSRLGWVRLHLRSAG